MREKSKKKNSRRKIQEEKFEEKNPRRKIRGKKFFMCL